MGSFRIGASGKSAALSPADDSPHHIYRVRVQNLAPLDHLRNIESPVAHLDAADVAMGAIEAPREFTLRYAGSCSDLREHGHDPTVSGCPELFRQAALSPKVIQCTLP